MKAIRVHAFGEPEVMKLEEVPDLHAGPKQVLVRIKAIGVNPVDTYIRSGSYPIKREMPFTPGLDGAGLVEEVGQGIGHIRVGDRVYTAGTITGSYAEAALCNESQVHRLPDNMTFSQGASVGVPYGEAYYGLFIRARALPGEFVLIHGASGGVGTAAVQLARAAGMTVIGTRGTDKGRAVIIEQGGHHA